MTRKIEKRVPRERTGRKRSETGAPANKPLSLTERLAPTTATDEQAEVASDLEGVAVTGKSPPPAKPLSAPSGKG